MKYLLALLSVLSLWGCASQPEEIETAYVSPIEYQDYSCNQIAEELRRVNHRANELYHSLKDTADLDEGQMALGLILFWPTLFFLEGGDGPEAQEYAQLKGEREALERSAIQKNCGLSEEQIASAGVAPMAAATAMAADSDTEFDSTSFPNSYYGAIAVSKTSLFSSGYCTDQNTPAQAESCAIRECGRHCEVQVMFESGECAAVAGKRGAQGVRRDDPSNRWWLGGSGVGASPGEALASAMAECQSKRHDCGQLVQPVCNG